MNWRREQKMREVEAEFDEPFWDVVQGFADMGYGKHGTAHAIDYDPSAFCRLIRDVGGHIRWPEYHDLKVWQDREYPDDWGERISAGRRKTGTGMRYVRHDGAIVAQRDAARALGVSEAQAVRLRRRGKLEEAA